MHIMLNPSPQTAKGLTFGFFLKKKTISYHIQIINRLRVKNEIRNIELRNRGKNEIFFEIYPGSVE